MHFFASLVVIFTGSTSSSSASLSLFCRLLSAISSRILIYIIFSTKVKSLRDTCFTIKMYANRQIIRDYVNLPPSPLSGFPLYAMSPLSGLLYIIESTLIDFNAGCTIFIYFSVAIKRLHYTYNINTFKHNIKNKLFINLSELFSYCYNSTLYYIINNDINSKNVFNYFIIGYRFSFPLYSIVCIKTRLIIRTINASGHIFSNTYRFEKHSCHIIL